MKLFRAAAFFLILISSIVNAQQVTTAMKILELSPSTSLIAMGSVGSSLPGTDIFSMYHNPAHLASTESIGNLSFQMLPENTHRNGQREITQRAVSATGGWQFDKLISGIPFRIGVGYFQSQLDLNTPLEYISYFEEYGTGKDEYTAFGAAVGFDYFLSFQAGITYKSIKSEMVMHQPVYSSLMYKLVKADISAMDYGLLITAPVMKLLNLPVSFSCNKDLKAMPFLNITAGYNLRNVGGEVTNSTMQKDPIGRTAILGYSVSAGIKAELTGKTFLDVIQFDWAVEAEDLLIKNRPYSQQAPLFEYQSGLGDIDPGSNIMQIKASNKVIVHKGMRVELGEVFQLAKGSFAGAGHAEREFEGLGIRTKGIFKLLKDESKIILFLAEHLDFRYFQCLYRNADQTERKTDSFSINISGIEKIF